MLRHLCQTISFLLGDCGDEGGDNGGGDDGADDKIQTIDTCAGRERQCFYFTNKERGHSQKAQTLQRPARCLLVYNCPLGPDMGEKGFPECSTPLACFYSLARQAMLPSVQISSPHTHTEVNRHSICFCPEAARSLLGHARR